MQDQIGTRSFYNLDKGTKCGIKWERDVSVTTRKGTRCRIRWEQDILSNFVEKGN